MVRDLRKIERLRVIQTELDYVISSRIESRKLT
jgi:hypothetical protein